MKTKEVIDMLGVKSNDMYDWLAKKKPGIPKVGGQYEWDGVAVGKARAYFMDRNKIPDQTVESPDKLFSDDAMTYIQGRASTRPLWVDWTEPKPESKPTSNAVYAYVINSVMNHLLMEGKIPAHADPHVALRDNLIDALLNVTRVLIERK